MQVKREGQHSRWIPAGRARLRVRQSPPVLKRLRAVVAAMRFVRWLQAASRERRRNSVLSSLARAVYVFVRLQRWLAQARQTLRIRALRFVKTKVSTGSLHLPCPLVVDCSSVGRSGVPLSCHSQVVGRRAMCRTLNFAAATLTPTRFSETSPSTKMMPRRLPGRRLATSRRRITPVEVSKAV